MLFLKGAAMELDLVSLTAILLLGAAIYLAGLLLYYVLFYHDVLALVREDHVTQTFLKLVNPMRAAFGKLPIWDVPQDVAEKETVWVAIDCLSHIQWSLDRYRPAHGRVVSNAATLKHLARKLVTNIVEALWSLQWSRGMTAKLCQLESSGQSDRVSRIQEIQQRDMDRLNHSFDSLVSLDVRLAELGSQVSDGDLEGLLAEYGEVLTQLEEDARALEEVRKTTLA